METIERALRAPSFVPVRRRLFRQLLESLLYEDALVHEGADDGRCTVHGVDEHGAAVRYRFTAVRRFGFDRVSVVGTLRRETAVSSEEPESVTRFLDEVRAALTADDDCLTRFAHELEETLVKDALAQYVRAERSDVLREAAYDTLEGTVTDGHRYHPAYKSRIGFDIEDNLAYGPEFLRPIRPLWLAAHRSITEVTVSADRDEAGFLLAQLGEATLAEFNDRIRAAGGAPADYTLLPVHPWQWRRQVTSAFSPQLRSGELIVVGEDPHDFAAQQSIRTLSCRDEPARPYLKLALSIVNTSTSRVLAPHTVRNAPAISDWLRNVVTGDEFLRDELGLIVLGEVMGSAVTPAPAAGFARGETYGTLACIWRESLYGFLAPGERAVPFTALTAIELDGTAMIEPWLHATGVREWVGRLVDVAAIPLLHLLFRHGIGCEAHAQNMVLVLRDGVPVRVALKDFHDGVRFSRDHLADSGGCPPLAGTPAHHVNANSFLETEDVDAVTGFVLDAFCFVNLAELGMLLADRFGLAEREFWAIVAERIRVYQERFPELADRFALFDVNRPGVEVEKLTSRRLVPDTEPLLHTVPNPLAVRHAEVK
ncbi:MAG: siderophore biosynthesis protein [Actinophytocola sp.]|nr:siderophore biosynthesis protein [Actinophytocola sp.]